MDVFRVERSVRLGLEFDMKRRPVEARMVEVGAGAHIAFDTVPWDTMEEAEKVRAVFTGWRRQHCLKNLEDWRHWWDFAAGVIKRRGHRKTGGAGIRRTDEGEVGVLRRVFLRAYAKQAWGVTRTLSYLELSLWLTESGYPTTVMELKNAGRAKLVENVVSVTDDVLLLLAVLRSQFPDLDVAKFVGEAVELPALPVAV